MKLLGAGLKSDPDISLPFIALYGAMAAAQEKLLQIVSALWYHPVEVSAVSTAVPKPMQEVLAASTQVPQLA